MIDKNIKDSLSRYVEQRIKPGGFLTAVLENNLMDAVARADTMNIINIHSICKYIYNELPWHVWGSPEKVKNHLENNNKII